MTKDFINAVKTCFAKYITISGRAGRPEFWWFAAFVFGGIVVFSLADYCLWPSLSQDASGPLRRIFALVTILPFMTAGWRRLQDAGRPGWYILLPAIFSVLYIVCILSGVVGFSLLQGHVADPETLRGPASLLGVAAVVMATVLQLAISGLLIWWLTRPPADSPSPPTL